MQESPRTLRGKLICYENPLPHLRVEVAQIRRKPKRIIFLQNIEINTMSGIMKCKRTDPRQLGENYAGFLAHTLNWDDALRGDVATVPMREVKYLGTLVNFWQQGSGDDRTTYYAFNLDGKTLTVQSTCLTCFIEDAKQEDYPNVPCPIDACIST